LRPASRSACLACGSHAKEDLVEHNGTQSDVPESSWRGLLKWGVVATIAMFVVIFAVTMEVIPPLIIGIVLLAGGLWWLRRPGRRSVIFLAVVTTLLLLMNLPFALPAMAHPDSGLEFAVTGATLVALVISIVAAVAELRSRRAPGGTPRRIAMAGTAVVVVLAVIGAVAAVSRENDTAGAGDLALAAKSFEWTAETLTAKPGQIGVFIENKDATRHDFKIKNVVSADLPASKKTRVTFEAPAGSYEFICSLHPEMKGTLTVG
jgi:plastocyanin